MNVSAMTRLLQSRGAAVLLPPLLGLACTLGFAPFDYWPLLMLAITGLLALWSVATPMGAFWQGMGFGMAHFCSGLYWIYISTHIHGGAPGWLSVCLIAGLAFILSLFIASAGLVSSWLLRGQRAVFLLLGLPCAWLAAELMRSWVGTGFPWFALGYAFIDTPLRLWAPVVGVYGMSAVVVCAAGALLLLIRGGRVERLLALGTLVLISLALNLTPPLAHWTSPKEETLSVALVQGNVPMDMKWRPEIKQPTLDHYVNLTAQAWDSRLIIWPEVAIPELYHRVADDYLAAIDQHARTAGKTLLVGVMEQQNPTAPLYNMVVALGADQGRYYKRHLVPFGEYFPVPEFMMDFINVYGLDYSDFAHGPKVQDPIVVGGEQIGLSICFEDVFGREIAEPLPQASLLVNMTNDAWFNDSTAPPQHLQIARMRTLETGRQLIRVANTGITTLIDYDGALLQRSPQFEVDILQVEAQPREGLTPFARWKDWPLVFIAVLGMLAAAIAGRLQR